DIWLIFPIQKIGILPAHLSFLPAITICHAPMLFILVEIHHTYGLHRKFIIPLMNTVCPFGYIRIMMVKRTLTRQLLFAVKLVCLAVSLSVWTWKPMLIQTIQKPFMIQLSAPDMYMSFMNQNRYKAILLEPILDGALIGLMPSI